MLPHCGARFASRPVPCRRTFSIENVDGLPSILSEFDRELPLLVDRLLLSGTYHAPLVLVSVADADSPVVKLKLLVWLSTNLSKPDLTKRDLSAGRNVRQASEAWHYAPSGL